MKEGIVGVERIVVFLDTGLLVWRN